jgi:preprotein translocase subunit SecG
MQQVLLVIHLLVVLALIGTVLLQRSEGGVLGQGGGGGFMTGRGQANALSRATAILAALFFATALAMSILASWGRSSRSVLDSSPAPISTIAPAKVNPLDALKPSTAPAPAAPAAPAPSAPPAPAPQPSDAPK